MIAEATPGVLRDVTIGALVIRHLASHRLDGGLRHTLRDIDPEEPPKHVLFDCL